MSCDGIIHKFPMRSRECECGEQVIGEPRFGIMHRRLSDKALKQNLGGRKGDLIDNCRLSETLQRRYAKGRAFRTLL